MKKNETVSEGADKKKMICHDCGKELKKGEEYANYTQDEENYLVKCRECCEKNPVLENYQECDVYSRVVGFHTPISRWNKGKAAEWEDRKTFKIDGDKKEAVCVGACEEGCC